MDRETKAMLFSVLHLPPLPVVVNLTDSEDHTLVVGEATESSHALLGNVLDFWTLARDYDKNMERMQAQVMCISNFRVELEQLDRDHNVKTCAVEKIYELYCRHTRDWFTCYDKSLGNQLYTRPWDYVVVGDKVHKNMCDYTKAQFYHMSLGNLKVDERVGYGELLRQCAMLRLEVGGESCSWVGGSCWGDEVIPAAEEEHGSTEAACPCAVPDPSSPIGGFA